VPEPNYGQDGDNQNTTGQGQKPPILSADRFYKVLLRHTRAAPINPPDTVISKICNKQIPAPVNGDARGETKASDRGL